MFLIKTLMIIYNYELEQWLEIEKSSNLCVWNWEIIVFQDQTDNNIQIVITISEFFI